MATRPRRPGERREAIDAHPRPPGPEPRPDAPDTHSDGFDVVPDRASVAWTRHRLRAQLICWGVEAAACEEPVLVLSELVTNALLHSRSRTIRCRLELTDSLLYRAVTDQGGTTSAPRPWHRTPTTRKDADCTWSAHWPRPGATPGRTRAYVSGPCSRSDAPALARGRRPPWVPGR